MGAVASTSSSSSFPPPPKKYDVFISFRGEDTRSNFTGHLYKALCDESISTYIDYMLPRGDEIAPSLLQAIQDSSVSVVVLSENYASSKWCLDELIHILRCRKHERQVVIPVFYKVDPSDVRKQNGTFQQAFAKHEQDFPHNLHKVNEWRNALSETANISGWDSRFSRDESELIQKIVSDVLQKLSLKYPSALNGLVGIDENGKSIELLLEKSPIIGIWGMGGIGKTTIAKAIFAKHFSQFDSHCFLENLTEQSEKHGMPYIRDKLLSELLPDSTRKVLGSTFSTRRLCNKKVLIVLDDVKSSKQLEYLAQECNCLGPNSRVIITTRDKHLLIGNDAEIYEAKSLNHQEALRLFFLKAFHKNHSQNGYEKLSERAVAYAQGNPLALTILGSFLYSKTMAEWESELKKLEKTPHGDIQKVLVLSYKGLDHEQREILLEIASFLKDEPTEHVITLLDSYGLCGRSGLRTLEDKALITVDYTVRMHDLIQDMGREIISQENIKEPAKRSRLWNPEEIYDVLKNNQGTESIEGIMLDMSQIKNLELNVKAFNKMTNLRFLKFSSPTNESNVNLPLAFELFSEKMRFFHWDRYPLKSLPSGFCPHKLVELYMRGSRVKRLWDGVQVLVNLKKIDMSWSMELMELPDFSMAHNLESVNLRSCKNLHSVHPSILSLHSLVNLGLENCSKLESLESETHLKSLMDLDVSNCNGLKKIFLSSEKMSDLYLSGCAAIEILHFPIGRFIRLRNLTINGSRLMSLPINELCCLTSLEVFHLFDFKHVIDKKELESLFNAWSYLWVLRLDSCINLSEIPDNISALKNLKFLSLKESSVEILPACIDHLSYLREIDLTECRRLRSILGLPPALKVLDASQCTSLETVFSDSLFQQGFLNLWSLYFNNCVKLDDHSVRFIEELTHFSIISASKNLDVKEFRTCYPGGRVPKWIRYKQTAEASNTIEFTCNLQPSLGIVYGCVVSPCPLKENLSVWCKCFDDNNHISTTSGFSSDLNSDHVFFMCNKFPQGDARKSYHGKITCEFFVGCWSLEDDKLIPYVDVPIKACGAWPIYEWDLKEGRKRKRDDAETLIGLDLELGLATKSNKSYKLHDCIFHPLQLKFLRKANEKHHAEIQLL